MRDRILSRRQLLQASAALGAASIFPGCASGDGDRIALPAAGPPFPRSILNGTRAEVSGALTVVAGKVPSDMLGHAMIVGGVPAGPNVPLFTGDGMIVRLSFEKGDPRVTTRLVRTDDFLLDEAVGQDAELGFTNTGMVRLSRAFGARNFANTALTPIGDGRLIASYDAGRPWEIDPLSLEVVSPVGKLSAYEPMIPAVTPGLNFFPLHMTTAHPAFDPDEKAVYVANFAPPVEGLAVTPFVRVLRWSRDAEPVSTKLVDDAGNGIVLEQSCHQMHVTKNFVVLSDGAFRIEPEQMLGQDVSMPQVAVSTLWIVRKTDLKPGGTAVAKRVRIPIESAHFLVDRNDDGDRVSLLLVHQNSADPSEWVRPNDVLPDGTPVDPGAVGMMVAPADLGIFGRYVVDATTGAVLETGRQLIDPRMWGATLWTQDARSTRAGFGTAFWVSLGFLPMLLTKRIVDMYANHPQRVVPLGDLPRQATPAQITRLDHDSMTIGDSFAFPIGHLPMSPTFVPRTNGGPDEGYVVCIVLGPEADEVWIFDGSSLSRGPVARLRHPQLDVGFSLHTAWMPDLVPSRKDGYRVVRADEYRERLESLSPRARDVATKTLQL
jgi:carotenoid cleavage dioxygenase-like enzyme